MNPEQSRSPAEVARIATRVGDLEQQIAEQNTTIQVLERRVSGLHRPLSDFSLSRLNEELEIETALSDAREKRGTLVYDRNFVTATS